MAAMQVLLIYAYCRRIGKNVMKVMPSNAETARRFAIHFRASFLRCVLLAEPRLPADNARLAKDELS